MAGRFFFFKETATTEIYTPLIYAGMAARSQKTSRLSI